MISTLTDLVASLQFATAPPGEFETFYPEADQLLLVGGLLNGLGAAQLDGFLQDIVAEEDGEVMPALTRAEGALVVLYTAKQMLDTALLNAQSRVRYKAGSAEYEEESAPSMLVQLHREASERLKQLRLAAQLGEFARAFTMVDAYVVNATARPSLGGYLPAGV